MAGNYGLADPASVMSNVPSYGSSVAGLSAGVTPAREGGGPAHADRLDLWRNPIREGGIEFVEGFGYRRRKGVDADGKPIYQDLTAQERQLNNGQYSWDREDAEKDRRRGAAAQQELRQQEATRLAREDAERNRQYGIQQTQLTQQGQQIQGVLQQIQQQGAAQQASNQLARDTLAANTSERQADRTQQATQFEATMAQQTEQLRLNNQLQGRRLEIEDSHFQQQKALDERNARRTQVLGSLSLIAQSLQRF